MFWACTHVMLKLTEIPLFQNLGIEIIPTEVTPNVMNYLEGIKYDDPNLEINKLWRQACTIPENVLIVLMRSRLWERDGLISDAEKELFNQYIDVMYVPTRLDLAVRISKWFKGSIVYRYFGDLLEGKKYLRNIPKNDLNAIRNMVYLPIFNSLNSEPVAKFFDIKISLHNYLDGSIVPRKWNGFKKGAHAVIILGSVHQFPPFQKILRALIPLAKKIPIKLLGKNVYSLLPKDIREAFHVKTDLDRDEFFDEFFSSQFLIYPHTRKNHSHNVPIEAIYGGMPILFRTKTPTFIENEHDLKVKFFPSQIGAAHTLMGFIKLALKTYNNEEQLNQLIQVQSRLTTPYSLENVTQEAKILLNHLEKKQIERLDPIIKKDLPFIPFATFPANLYFSNLKNVVENNFSAPIYQFFSNSILNNINVINFGEQTHLVLALEHVPVYTQLILGVIPGAEAVYFCADKKHEITIDGFISGSGRCDISLDAYVNNAPVDRALQRQRSSSQDLIFFSKKFILSSTDPFHISLVIKVHGTCSVYAKTIQHKILNPEESHQNHNMDEWMYADELENDEKKSDSKIIQKNSKPLQLIPFALADVHENTKFNYAFNFIEKKPFKTNVTIEYWEKDKILERKIYKIDSCQDTLLTHKPNFGKIHGVKPIIYIHPAKNTDLYFASVRILSLDETEDFKKKL